ncbi:MAG TPA: malectin domain-containing carbohydrate-binding protein, partial [Pyrinomonadaceae bacterium]|nr:malectin domain-containing carbohydrate-binding protein [Pyrinomonadaceae bacterium]
KGGDDLYPATVELAKKLNTVAKTEDPTRPTTIALHGSELYNKYGLADVPDVVGWNLYLGWYSGEIDQFGRFLDDQHKRYPTRPLIVSEYGANADRRFHSTEPRRFDSTSEYSRKFHESYLAQLDARSYISGSTLWNNFDFGAENRGETIPHVNQKGMLTFDRKPKDVYYFYKAALSKAQVMHVAVGDQPIFAGNPDREFPIDVYSNSGEVDLELNGKSLGRKPADGTHKATWNVHFKPGNNTLWAGGTSTSDKAEVTFIGVTASSPEIAINVGSNADYTDASGRVWLADRPFKNGTWGFVGAAATRVYGTPGDPNIRETIDDGLFQTMCEGLEGYKIDVPAGNYQVVLMFAETKNEKAGKRIFDVSINSKPAITGLDLAASPGAYKPLVKTFDVTTRGGIEISFSAKTGKAILNGLRIVRK